MIIAPTKDNDDANHKTSHLNICGTVSATYAITGQGRLVVQLLYTELEAITKIIDEAQQTT